MVNTIRPAPGCETKLIRGGKSRSGGPGLEKKGCIPLGGSTTWGGRCFGVPRPWCGSGKRHPSRSGSEFLPSSLGPRIWSPFPPILHLLTIQKHFQFFQSFTNFLIFFEIFKILKFKLGVGPGNWAPLHCGLAPHAPTDPAAGPGEGGGERRRGGADGSFKKARGEERKNLVWFMDFKIFRIMY